MTPTLCNAQTVSHLCIASVPWKTYGFLEPRVPNTVRIRATLYGAVATLQGRPAGKPMWPCFLNILSGVSVQRRNHLVDSRLGIVRQAFSPLPVRSMAASCQQVSPQARSTC